MSDEDSQRNTPVESDAQRERRLDLDRREAELVDREAALREAGKELLIRERNLRGQTRLLEQREHAFAQKSTQTRSDSQLSRPFDAARSDSRPMDVLDAELAETVEDSAISNRLSQESAEDDEADEHTGVKPATLHATEKEAENTPSSDSYESRAPLLPLGELSVFAHNQQVCIRVRVEDALAEPAWSMRMHFVTVQGVPVFVLSLHAKQDNAERTWTHPLNSRQYRDRMVLDTLRKKFRAAIEWGTGDEVTSDGVVDTRMESNMLRALDRSARLPVTPNVDFEAHQKIALEELAHLPGLPIFLGLEAASLAEVWQHVASARAFADPETFDPILLLHGVPEASFVGALRRTVNAAVENGLWLPPALLSRAQEAGLGSSREALAADMTQRFVKRCEDSFEIGLGESEVHENLRQLILVAQELGAELDPESVERAWRVLYPTPPDITQISLNELKLASEHPKLRIAALHELVRRYRESRLDDTAPADEWTRIVFAAFRRASRADTLSLVPLLTSLGDQVGEQVLALLDSSRLHVRLAAVAILSKLRVRRALVALTSLLLSEPSDAWKEIARALANFGASAAKPLCRAVADRKNPRNRVAYALALLQAMHPDAKEIIETEAQESDPALLVALKGAQPFAMEHMRVIATGSLESADEYQALGIEIATALAETSA